MATYEIYQARADARRAQVLAATASPFTIEVRRSSLREHPHAAGDR